MEPGSGLDGPAHIGDVDEGLVVSSIAGPAPGGLELALQAPTAGRLESTRTAEDGQAPRFPRRRPVLGGAVQIAEPDRKHAALRHDGDR